MLVFEEENSVFLCVYLLFFLQLFISYLFFSLVYLLRMLVAFSHLFLFSSNFILMLCILDKTCYEIRRYFSIMQIHTTLIKYLIRNYYGKYQHWYLFSRFTRANTVALKSVLEIQRTQAFIFQFSIAVAYYFM